MNEIDSIIQNMRVTKLDVVRRRLTRLQISDPATFRIIERLFTPLPPRPSHVTKTPQP